MTLLLNLRSRKGNDADKALQDLGLYSEYLDDKGKSYLWDTEGCSIIVVENVVIVDAVLDGNGDQVTPPEYSDMRHFNCVVGPNALWPYTEVVEGETVNVTRPLEDYLTEVFELAVTTGDEALKNKTETAYKLQNLEFMDMSTVDTPARIIL